MTDRKQFEAMLDALLNEDQEAAKEIFHNIVVAKSRDIYEELLAEDFDISEEEEETDDSDEEVDEAFGDEGDDEAGDDGDDEAGDDEIGGDATDDFIDDTDSESDFGSDEEGEGDIEDRVLDLEDALEELKAEFDELMADEEGEPEHSDMFGAEEPEMGSEEPAFGGDEFGSEEEPMDEFSMFMEYVNKVALPKHGDNGVNTKSIIAKKNDMGGTTANIAKSFSTEKGGTEGGLLKPSTQEENFGNVNVPGGNAGKTAFKKKEPGHGAEKKGSSEQAPNKKSIIGSSK